ncbi:hypothetical protein GCM10009332_02620 [Shewanella gelidii]|uniref:Uncharacterized protein n=1 Tax=Shewanella gelidii TaxID=1642821 RepID=A0A917JL51_9GAMM|nr:hypothetical protein GCM10009332_02620 [Shewanella gelidii]
MAMPPTFSDENVKLLQNNDLGAYQKNMIYITVDKISDETYNHWVKSNTKYIWESA